MTDEVALPLKVKGKEAVERDMRSIGEDGKKMGAVLERSGKTGSKGLRAVDAAAGEAKDKIEDLADEAGVLAKPLKALGPIGVGVGAGIGAVVIGLTAAVSIGRQAVDTFAAIGNEAEALGLSAETYQALRAESDALGISYSALETGARTLKERQSQIADGQGELYAKLKETNPGLLQQLQNLSNTEDQLRVVAEALKSATNETDRNRIAFAAFGGAGADLTRILTSTEDGVDGLISKGKELGLVMDNELIANAQQLSTEMAIAGTVLDLQLKQAFIDFAPIAQNGVEALSDLAVMARRVRDNFIDASQATSEFNADRILKLSDRLERRGIDAGRIRDSRTLGSPLGTDDLDGRRRGQRTLKRIQEEIDEFNRLVSIEADRAASALAEQYRRTIAGMTTEELEQVLEEENDRLQRYIQESDRAETPDRRAVVGQAIDTSERRIAAVESILREASAREEASDALARQREEEENLQKAQRDADKTAREYVQLRRQAALLMSELGDHTLALALKEEELNRIRDAGLLTQQEVDEALRAHRDRLNGTTEAVQRWLDVISGGQTEVESIQEQIKLLNQDLADGKLGEAAAAAELYSDALYELTVALGEAQKAEREGTDVFKAAEEVRRKLAEARKEALSDEERIANERARLDALVEAEVLSRQDAIDALALYTEKLKEAREEVGLLSRAEEILDGIESGRIRTVKDLGRAILDMILQVTRQAAMSQASAGGAGGFGGFVQGILGALGGAFGLGSGSGNVGTPPIVAPGLQQAHQGAIIGQPPRQRRSSAPLAPDERMVIARVGEEVSTEMDRKSLLGHVRALANAALQPSVGLPSAIPLAIRITARTEGNGTAEVEASPSADGQGIDIGLTLREMVRGQARSGDLNEALQAQGFTRKAIV